jgi:hypothetical protein
MRPLDISRAVTFAATDDFDEWLGPARLGGGLAALPEDEGTDSVIAEVLPRFRAAPACAGC